MHGFHTGGSSVMLIPGDLLEHVAIPQQPGIAEGHVLRVGRFVPHLSGEGC